MQNPAAGKLVKTEWSVRLLQRGYETNAAHALICDLHYTRRCSPVFAYVMGLIRVNDGALLGAAWWKAPLPNAANRLAEECGCAPRETLELSRLVVHPDVPGNGASFLLGRAERIIRQDGRFAALVTFADEHEGHTGAIYKATNWTYTGLIKPEPIYIDPETEERVARKQDRKTYRHSEMLARGYVLLGYSQKHRFTKCLR